MLSVEFWSSCRGCLRSGTRARPRRCEWPRYSEFLATGVLGLGTRPEVGCALRGLLRVN
ncbi:Protein of unknown function [Pyronema omphalodes CBS 100304]|uniref:Uncharacterized protein n=1 Tax=Pyronema omphalodes (strain CBS 100304) TaxID=1076935 RepID=U4LXF1_PYROM|nr:Protein of unknown function [Pyronema omphalodes CBS 100304]